MTGSRALSSFAWMMMALPALLGACLCYFRPEKAWLWAPAMVVLPVLWLGLGSLERIYGTRSLMRSEDAGVARREASFAVIVSCLALAMPMSAKLFDALGLVDPLSNGSSAIRLTNILIGAYLIVRGNGLPKILTFMSDHRYDPRTLQTLRRRVGWSFVLTGFAYAVIWVVLPEQWTLPAGIAVILIGVLMPTVWLRSYGRWRGALWRHRMQSEE